MIQRVADSYRPRFKKRFLEIAEGIRGGVPDGDLRDAIAMGQWWNLMSLIPWDRFAEGMAGFGQLIEPLVDEAENRAMVYAERITKQGFIVGSPFVQEFIQARTAFLATEVVGEPIQATSEAINRAFQAQAPPVEAARRVKASIGLTRQQARAVDARRAAMLEAGVDPSRITRAADVQALRYLKERASTIAETETMTGANEGTKQAWDQAARDGLLPPGQMVEWVVVPDDRLCPRCQPMAGGRVPVGQQFPGGGPPLHIRCRCGIALVL